MIFRINWVNFAKIGIMLIFFCYGSGLYEKMIFLSNRHSIMPYFERDNSLISSIIAGHDTHDETPILDCLLGVVGKRMGEDSFIFNQEFRNIVRNNCVTDEEIYDYDDLEDYDPCTYFGTLCVFPENACEHCRTYPTLLQCEYIKDRSLL